MSKSGWHGANPLQLGLFKAPPQANEKNGVVYTKPWVVDLVLDLAGYLPEKDLIGSLVVEPAAGDGAFLLSIVRRLVTSCRRQRRPILDCRSSLLAFELDEDSARVARQCVKRVLLDEGVGPEEVHTLVAQWIRMGNYLLEARTLEPADFIVGNPPYIRSEDMKSDERAIYRHAFKTMQGRADIYVAFFEAALRQLKPEGVCAFICADRWMLNQYGAELRRMVTSSFGVETIVEMHKAEPFEREVSAYPAIVVIRRSQQKIAVVATVDAHAATVRSELIASSLQSIRHGSSDAVLPIGVRASSVETWFTGSDPWPCISPERLSLLRRLEDQYCPLESSVTGTRVGIGVATGRDDVFITTNPRVVEDSRLLPLAMAADIRSGKVNWSGHYLINPWVVDGLVDLSTFPRLAAHFESHSEGLRRRHVAVHNPRQWYRTIDRVNNGLISRPKLYVPDIKNRIAPALDNGQTYPHHNLYFILSEGWDLEVLGGLLLSDIAQFFVECYGVRMRGGYFRFQAQYLRRIRVPKPQDIDRRQTDGLIRAFRQRDVSLSNRIAVDLYGMDALPGG